MAATTGSIEGGRFVTMRFERIKTWSHIYHVRRHNMREMECRHLEKDAPPPRYIVGNEDVSGAIRAVLDRYGVKHKPGEVLALEFVVSTSREVFEDLSPPDRQRREIDLIVCTLRAFCDRFKIKGQIVSAALHLDERTPHLHLVVVPLICEPDNRRKDRAPIYRLSAKRVIGGWGDMCREQTRFAKFFEEMGLERGKERSGARHISNRDHEAMLEDARVAALAERDALASDRQIIADAAIDLGRERDGIAAERAELERQWAAIETEQTRLREEGERLDAERVMLMEKTGEAEALKARAIKRVKTLGDLLEAGEKLRDYVLALPAERRGPQLQRAHSMTQGLASASQRAAQDDAWLAAMLAHRAGQGHGAAIG